MSHEKNNGIFFTPPGLAEFIAKMGISSKNSMILDPSFGEGSLLLAARERLQKLNSRNPNKQLFGYDISPPKNVMDRICDQGLLDIDNLIVGDFFRRTNETTKFDVIIMNPPFVRHHLIPQKSQKRIRKILGDETKLPLTSDLWAYFIIHSLQFLRKKGNLVTILPWSFLHADYASKVRKLIFNRFHELKVVMIGQRLFKKVEERVLVLIGEGYESPTLRICINYSKKIPKREIEWVQTDLNHWENSLWRSLIDQETHKILSDIELNINFQPLSKFASVKIGTVTGANDFFILNKNSAEKMKLPKRVLRPILRHSSMLRKLSLSKKDDVQDLLISIPEKMKLSQNLKDYTDQGENNGINDRCHTKKRKKWYSIPKQESPDGFLPYMTKEVPFIVLNPDGILSTNTIHNIYFTDKIDEYIKKWIQFSMFSSLSQLSVEIFGRTYGGGVLKIEPSAANNILVYSGNSSKFPKHLENKMKSLLSNGAYSEVRNLVDEWMEKNNILSENQITLIKQSYENLRDLRLGN